MNKYDLLVNKWEHQGYEMREDYWNSMVNLFLSSAALMRTSLNERIDTYEEATGSEPGILNSKASELDELIEKVNTEAGRTQVTRRTDNVRYYRAAGHEMLVYAEASKQDIAALVKKADAKNYQNLTYWKSMYTAQSGAGAGAPAITAEQYQNIYDDYNKGVPDDKKISLYDIFFDEKHGNITPPSGTDSSCIFMSSTAQAMNIPSSSRNAIWDIMFNGTDGSYPSGADSTAS